VLTKPTFQKKTHIEIAVAGGIPVLLAAMVAQRQHAGVHEHGCCVLGNIASNEAIPHLCAGGNHLQVGTSKNTDNTAAIAAAGGIPVVLVAMKAHKRHAGVQHHGCRALANLACNAKNNTAIAAAGAMSVVLVAMAAHTRHGRAGARLLGAGHFHP